MKKFFAAVFAAFLGVSALFADDVADVKAVIYKNHELQERHDFKALPDLYSQNYVQMNARGECFDYVMLMLLLISMDGKHPEEFLQFMAMQGNGGRLPTPETMARISQMALDPEVVREYRAALVKILAYSDKELAAWRKTVKFVSFQIKGDFATVIEEYDGYDPESGAAKHKTCTMILRRENGVWYYYRVIDGE